MKNEISIRFIIEDFETLTHDEITVILGIQPDVTQKKGKNLGEKSGMSFVGHRNVWALNASPDNTVSFEEQLKMLTDIIEPKLEAFKIVCDTCKCLFSTVIFLYPEDTEPSIFLDRRTIAILNTLGAEFDIDIQNLCPSRENDDIL